MEGQWKTCGVAGGHLAPIKTTSRPPPSSLPPPPPPPPPLFIYLFIYLFIIIRVRIYTDVYLQQRGKRRWRKREKKRGREKGKNGHFRSAPPIAKWKLSTFISGPLFKAAATDDVTETLPNFPPSTASGLAAGQVAQDQPSFATWPGAMSFPTPHLHKFGSRVGFLSVAQCSSAVHLICIGRSQAMWNIQWELICIRWPVTPDSCWFFDCQWVIVSFACREEILGNLHPFGQGSHLHRTARRCQIFKIGAVHAGRALIE